MMIIGFVPIQEEVVQGSGLLTGNAKEKDTTIAVQNSSIGVTFAVLLIANLNLPEMGTSLASIKMEA